MASNSDMKISGHTADKVQKAKLSIENYYENLNSQHAERLLRYKKLETSLEKENVSDDQRRQRMMVNASKETDYLRMKRCRMSAEDFEPLKVRVRFSSY